ncbi:MAG: MFS transporter, partial [Lachnospiraceae bacterium]|nr:MFS transporter [Lachnospiraceae bacterium]
MKAKKYFLSMVCVYMAYLTHGMQALIFSQNQVNFATKWGFDMSDPTSAAYAAGAAAVSTAIAWTGLGKFLSVWIGGEISDRVGRKKLMIGGAALYIVCFATMFTTSNATIAAFAGLVAGVATSGFWDASGYPAVQEAYPKAPGSALIMIKFFVALSSIFYPLICVKTAAAGNWTFNIILPLVLSCVVLALACFAKFVYDDEMKAGVASGKGNRADQAEIDAAKARQLVAPGKFTGLLTYFYAFLVMAVMYGAQQYTKAFGLAYCGLSEMQAASMTTMYQI